MAHAFGARFALERQAHLVSVLAGGNRAGAVQRLETLCGVLRRDQHGGGTQGGEYEDTTSHLTSSTVLSCQLSAISCYARAPPSIGDRSPSHGRVSSASSITP